MNIDTKNPTWLKRIEQTLENTIQCIRGAINAKAICIVVVHEDHTTQTSTAISPGYEARTAFALRAMADKVEKGQDVKVVMSGEIKN